MWEAMKRNVISIITSVVLCASILSVIVWLSVDYISDYLRKSRIEAYSSETEKELARLQRLKKEFDGLMEKIPRKGYCEVKPQLKEKAMAINNLVDKLESLREEADVRVCYGVQSEFDCEKLMTRVSYDGPSAPLYISGEKVVIYPPKCYDDFSHYEHPKPIKYLDHRTY